MQLWSDTRIKLVSYWHSLKRVRYTLAGGPLWPDLSIDRRRKHVSLSFRNTPVLDQKIILDQHKRHERQKWQTIPGQDDGFGFHGEDSIKGSKPGHHERESGRRFVRQPDRLVGLVNAKIGMQKDATRQAQSH